ncbi:MAG: nuclear transport factor 2 family protein [Bryobacterales bacterium]|nr:nuclear transport factor 2 family protein [Bryobacterales bacterium]
MNSPFFLLLALSIAVTAQPLPADDPHAADRRQMLAILREVEASINEQSLERMAKQMDPAATVVWANGEVSRGPAEILAYYDRMVKGPDRVLSRYTTKAALNGHARFLADGTVAIADGTMEDEFTSTVRGPFKLKSNWSTTLAKTNGEWKVVSLHLSANVFNNVLLDDAKAALVYTGGGGALAGALLGWYFGRRKRA